MPLTVCRCIPSGRQPEVPFPRAVSMPRADSLGPNTLGGRFYWGAFPEAQRVKNLLAMQETWVRSRGQEDPLEKGVATHSSILAWRIPWTEEPGGLQSMGVAESDTTEGS